MTLPGTTVFSTTDPAGDDNGPGTYQYPTSSNFTAGSFDLTGLKVNETATDVYLQISLRDLAPTFGSNFGAQMLDIYAPRSIGRVHLDDARRSHRRTTRSPRPTRGASASRPRGSLRCSG